MTSQADKSAKLNRRSLIAGSASAAMVGAGLAGTPDAGATGMVMAGQTPVPDDYHLPSIAELADALANGDLTVRDLTQQCLDRIDTLDKQGPAINAIIELNPDALTIADELDAELAASGPRGPFHGIPVLLKDNIATFDKMQTTAGSLALVDVKPTSDSTVARVLREAGAVILGKTNLSEWANIRSFQSSSGWSGRGGQTLNPHQLDRQASGSSSGSGAAAAAAYVPVTIGTETNGSIVSPASFCGVVGIKPTVGLVSRHGIIPISHSQDTAGPIARTVADVAATLTVLAVQDQFDPAQEGPTFHTASAASTPDATEATPVTDPNVPTFPAKPEGGVPKVDYVAELDANSLQGARIGVLMNATGWSPHADAVLQTATEAMEAAGAEIIPIEALPGDAERLASSDGLNVLLWELKTDLAAYAIEMLEPTAPIRTLADVIAFNDANAETEMPYFDQSLFLMAEATEGTADPAYPETMARLQRWTREEGLDAVFAEHNLSALVAPTNSPAGKIDLVNGDHFLGGSSTPSAVAGYPAVTVPAGTVHGLPIGISFMGTAWSEGPLLSIAYAFEQATNARVDPQFVPGSVIPPVDAATAQRRIGGDINAKTGIQDRLYGSATATE